MSVIPLLAFAAVVLGVLAVVHTYIWWRVVRSTTRPGGRGRRIGKWLVIAAFVLTTSAQVGGMLLTRDLSGPFAWVGFTWLGFAFYLFLFLILGELIRFGGRVLGPRRAAAITVPDRDHSAVPALASGRSTTVLPERGTDADLESGAPRTSESDGTDDPPPGGPPEDAREVTRRLFLSRSIAVGAAVAAASVSGYGISRALADPAIRRIPVQIAGLDPRLAGFRIAMFGDAHIGSIRRRPTMERLVDMVNGTEPDLVAIVGDLIDGSVADLAGDVAPLARLQSPQGTFFVTGNHEYYSGVEEWVRYLAALGVRVLANERLAIEHSGAAFDLAGVNDLTGDDGYDGGPDYDRALDGRDRDRPVVLLSHQPITVAESVSHGVDLQLSAHTHAGQLWPFRYVVGLQQGAVQGLSQIEDTQLYVNAGVGFWGPPMRVGADPELTVIELQPAGVED